MRVEADGASPRFSWGRSALARLSRGRTPAALLDQALVSGANFLTNVLLARGFGVREYGVYALAWLAVLFANSLQYALIVTPMMSVGPKQEEEERPGYFGAVLLHELGFAPVAAGIVLLAVTFSTRWFPRWDVGGLSWPLSAATLAYLLQDFVRRYFFCIGRSGMALASDGVSYLLQLPILFWISRHGGGSIAGALWVIAGTSLAGFVPFMVWYGPVRFGVRPARGVWARHWKMSRWLAPSAFLQWGAGNLFLMAAPVYYGAAASALLRAANNIVAVAHVWYLGLDNVAPPEAARQMRLGGVEAMLRYVRRVVMEWGGVTLAFTGAIALCPGFWLRLAYGSKYLADGSVLRLYALLYLITFLSLPLRAGLQALEYTKPVFWAYPAMIGFSAALAGPFARRLGLNGVMLGMCCTQMIFQAIVWGAFWMRVRSVRRGIRRGVDGLWEGCGADERS